MKPPKEDPPQGPPAFMTTYADLMTLLLVFFILLNVYSNERQYGLLSAMTGSVAAAFYKVPGQGGLLQGSKNITEQGYPQPLFKFSEKGEGEETRKDRSGKEVELSKSRAEKLDSGDEQKIVSPFTFPHGASALSRKARRYLDKFARIYGSPDYQVCFEASAGFVESFQPMELAAERARAIHEYLQAVGMTSVTRVKGRVVEYRGLGRLEGDAPYRAAHVTVTRSRK